MEGDRFSVNANENINSAAESSRGEQLTYQDLGEQVSYDPDRAQRLRNGEDADDTPEQSDGSGPMEYVPEDRDLSLELPDDDDEEYGDQPAGEKDADNTEKGQEKSRAERKLAAIEAKLEKIDQELHEARNSKEKIEEEIDACEAALEDNNEQFNQLSDRAEELKVEIKRTKRNALNGLANGLRIVKNLALGRHDEVRKILGEISGDIDANEKATDEQVEVNDALSANETEHATLNSAYENAVDERSATVQKIRRLERQRSEASKQKEMLKEEVANEAWSEAWADAQEGIKSEMGTDNIAAFRRELSAQQEELDENLEDDLTELDGYRNPSRIQRMMRTDEELARDAERADEIEDILRDEHEQATSIIDAKREKIDHYFPTWQERVKQVRENKLVGGALSSLKRKILTRMRRI